MSRTQKNISVKWNVIIAAVSILIIGIGAIAASCLYSSYDKMTLQMKLDGNSIVNQAAKRISESVDKYDDSSSANIQKIVDDLGNEDGIVYALLIDKDLNAVAHSNHSRIGASLSDEGSKSAAVDKKSYSSTYFYDQTSENVYDVLLPISIGGEHFGALNIGLSMKALESIESSSSVIISDIEKIDLIAQDSAANSEEVAASSEEQAASAEQIADSIENLMNMINGLSSEIEKFNVK